MFKLFVFGWTIISFAVLVYTAEEGDNFGSANDIRAFVTDGLHVLSGLGSLPYQDKFQNSAFFHETIGCETKCNGEPFTEKVCIGHTEVDCSRVVSDDVMSLYRRVCDGKFENETSSGPGFYETDQGCKGITRLSMTQERKTSESNLWEVELFYQQTCFTKYATFIDQRESDNGTTQTRVAAVCVGASEISFSDGKCKYTRNRRSQLLDSQSARNAQNFSTAAEVTCNSKSSATTKPCDGVLVAKEQDETSTKTLICDGNWLPYDNVLFECEGDQDFISKAVTEQKVSERTQNCTGVAAASFNSDASTGFEICNGESSFQDRILIQPVM